MGSLEDLIECRHLGEHPSVDGTLKDRLEGFVEYCLHYSVGVCLVVVWEGDVVKSDAPASVVLFQ